MLDVLTAAVVFFQTFNNDQQAATRASCNTDMNTFKK